MNGMHEPREEFVAALESRLAARARFRPRRASLPAWMPQSRSLLAAAAAIVIVVSMGIGGAVVAFAYQAQTAEGRQMLMAAYTQRLQLAQKRLDLAQKFLSDAQTRVEIGGASRLDLRDAQQKMTAARAEVQSVQLQIEEIQLTGREPADQVSAALVSGRDFVSQRWQVDVTVPAGALETEQLRLTEMQQRVAVGMADAFDLEASRARVTELRFTLEGLQRKLEIRRQFLNHEIDAALADLRVLEAEADQRVRILTGKVDLSRKETARITARVQVGAAQQLDAAEASLRVLAVEYELSKANYDLMLIRKQIAQRGR
jgi:outer membrane protein TolC